MEEAAATDQAAAVNSVLTPIESILVHKYLESLLPVLLDATPNSPLISVETTAKFTNDSQISVVFITKERDLENAGSDDPTYTYNMHLSYTHIETHLSTIAIIKKSPILESSKPIQEQVQLMVLPGYADANAFESLLSYIHNGISPFFDAYVKGREGDDGDKDGKTGIPMTKKKIAELELSFLHLQQNVEIPDISLNIHPLVQKSIDACRQQGVRVNVDAIRDHVSDSTFLNKLQGDVNGWIKEIQKVTKLTRDPASGTASQEINFWVSKERALSQIEQQLKSDEIVLTLDILKTAKRFHATVSFLADTGLKESTEQVLRYNLLMKDFPLNELLSATDMEKIRNSLILLFGHLNKKLKLSPYPIKRALPLVEAISRDFNEQLIKVLSNFRLMHMSYQDFEATMNKCDAILLTWDEQVKEFTHIAREVTRKRSEKFIPIKIVNAHAKLEERIAFVRAFRRQHAQLYSTIVKVTQAEKINVNNNSPPLATGTVDAVEDVIHAYKSVENVDVLDVSSQGTELWVAAERTYNDRVARVENQIISRLRDRLGTVKNANEMFRVFSKFNALFIRPKIRGAIQEYQTQLIDSVKEDIQKLHDKFKAQYRNSQAALMSSCLDLPPISGAIIWARQIERQLGLYMKRVEDILGRGWELYAEGQKLQNDSLSFTKKLDTRPIFDAWLQEINRRDLSVTGRVFDIRLVRSLGNILQIGVNFDSQVITLFKEVRNLLWLNFQVPHMVTNVAKDAKRVYPFATSLMETVATYNQIGILVARNEHIESLVSGYRKDVQDLIAKGIQLRWDYFVNTFDTLDTTSSMDKNNSSSINRHVVFVRDFASTVSIFQDKVNGVLGIYEEINAYLSELRTCAFSKEKFDPIINSIQKSVDKLNLESYTNLESWTIEFDKKIENILIDRLQVAIKMWTNEFLLSHDSEDLFAAAMNQTNKTSSIPSDTKRKLRSKRSTLMLNIKMSTNEEVIAAMASAAEHNKKDDHSKPVIRPIVHELSIKNQVMFLDPPIEDARVSWYGMFHEWIANVCSLKRIESSRYEIGLNVQVDEVKSYSSALSNLKDNCLENAFATIEEKLTQVSKYINVWLQYQSLWDLDSEQVFLHLGEDLNKWQQLVTEIKKARATFDNSETSKSFGSLIVDYEQVQSKVNAKYDQWQREVISKFGSKLGSSIKDLFNLISKSRDELEKSNITESGAFTSTADAVSFIIFIQDLKKQTFKWSEMVESFKQGQRTLEKNRYRFADDWLYADHLDGEWTAFNAIFMKKNKSIQEQIAHLQKKIVSEDNAVDQKIKEFCTDWDKNKPVLGNIKPDNAIQSLNIFEGKVSRLRDESDQIYRAKEALDLETSKENRLIIIHEELKDLKEVWSTLSITAKSIDDIKETLWSTVAPRKLRQQLDKLIISMKNLPSRMRQYAAFEYIHDTLKGYVKINSLVVDLKSESLRDRHWKQIFKTLPFDAGVSYTELTLGNVWDIDLKKHEQSIKDIITAAQGEMALEEFLRQVKETWNGYTIELINYQNKCRLVRGWDDLFTKCSENLSSLTAMKHSPYYKVFEEDASSWEDKLSRVHLLFDVWIDVQRQWVYLEGIFSGSADIKNLLPVETTRFQNINTEFMSVMKKVYKSPFIMDVLNIPNIQKSFERLADLLSKIQKALGEYLEKERSSFPRFYFVGDEDLLEIIGNSKDVVRIQKHFKKLFAGVTSLLLDDTCDIIQGLSSREGESVLFKTPISIKANPRINDWLSMIESEMKMSLAILLGESVQDVQSFYSAESLNLEKLVEWMDKFPAQLVILTIQIVWTSSVEIALGQVGKVADDLSKSSQLVEQCLNILADMVLTDLPIIKRRKCEHLITELVHQRDVIRSLRDRNVESHNNFMWLYHMRFYFDSSCTDPLKRLSIRMANASFPYGFEYLGVADRLVQTPLTDRCYLTLTQALDGGLGGNPFGPAGTGKTESVKALGVQLGRFVLVFCCDENFDFQAMGRIFIGLSQVGAWGCFDEFNRLEERILSAVSQQVQTIQLGLKSGCEIELVSKHLVVNPNTGIFITMNPGYAGRSNLPDNLKKLFRCVAMTKPDRELIAQVMLFSQGFRSAELLSSKVVPFFNLCSEQLSPQSHYDFGLRSLKSVLVSAGNLKRDRLIKLRSIENVNQEELDTLSNSITEQEIVIQSVRETLVPKLVVDDIPLLQSLLLDVFPGIKYVAVDLEKLRNEIQILATEQGLVGGELWLEKVLQLYQIQNIHHGLMMVGPSGSGKSSAWRILLTALERIEGVEGVSYVIDPKALSKESLYGSLDPTTREWTDGLFTTILRKIIDNVRGEGTKRHWVVFDGDVDPEWVENLNSVLDDNKLLTLPNGERLGLPNNMRIMFEVDSLKYATLATVSRCGMVWFSSDVVSPYMMISQYLELLCNHPLDGSDDDLDAFISTSENPTNVDDTPLSQTLDSQRQIANILRPFFLEGGLISKSLEYADKLDHIMDFTVIRALTTLFSLLNKTVRSVLEYNSTHPDFPISSENLESFISKRLLLSIVWSLSGDAKLDLRTKFGAFLGTITSIGMPDLSSGNSIIDFDVDISTGEWFTWQSKVPVADVAQNSIIASDVVISTIDTLRHEEILYSWLSEHKPLLLCGPPGSGKTMTLFAALRKLPDMEIVDLNFSSATTPELVMKTLEQYCEYRKTLNGVVLAPINIGRWLVLFCDEINLPAIDKYGTQRIISFLRQLVEHGGYWRITDKVWVKLERIQFVGACNPPTDPGRIPMSHRFLRHSPLIMVDYPGELSLKQIYGTFSRAILKVVPSLRGFADSLTDAMVEFYLLSQKRFTPDMQAHYIYSPRELTRWVRGIYEVISQEDLPTPTLDDLVRIWAHEALRLFQDRLVTEEEKDWTDKNIDLIACKHFPSIDQVAVLRRPILFSDWTSKLYLPVEQSELRALIKGKSKGFYEEELDAPLVLFDDVLEHCLRINRVFRQVQGHLLLIGVSGSGKTTLSRFVAWMQGLKTFQVKVHNKYTTEDFDEDLRGVLRRVGCKGERICFILDESNVLDTGFLERMNTLLANGEVPGLFEGDEYSSLMNQCRESMQRENIVPNSNEEIYKWFTKQIMKNLHVVFTMNPPEEGLATRAATSPALFNRCVLDWFGDWNEQAFYQVAQEFTSSLDIDNVSYKAPIDFPLTYKDLPTPPSYKDAVINAFVFIHQSLYDINNKLAKRQHNINYVTPRHYLDFINHYVRLFNEKRDDLEEQQRHLNVGVEKLRDTVVKVEEMRKNLAVKRTELEEKTDQANEKLKKMVAGQQEAEKKKNSSLALQEAIKKQDIQIEERQRIVGEDLSKAEPAVLEAQESVSNIKKQHLTELRSMSNPPAAVKLALEAVCTLLGHKIDNWKSIVSVLRKDDFISSIVDYDTDKLTATLRKKVQAEYIELPNFTFEIVNRASKACGPLVQWVIAQVSFSDILDRVGPLRREVQALEESAQENKTKASEIQLMVKELEERIATYKDEYAVLISETQALKSEMETVKFRVDRSLALLANLSSESERWDISIQSFSVQMGTIVGDVLLSAAFLAYAGYFNQQYRESLFKNWSDHLSKAGLFFKSDVSLSDYLSTADERLSWHDNALPADDLCVENAIMLSRFDRYPLIIDPSGQATAFLLNEYKDKRIAITSFLDDSFLKVLESALRFGSPLIIQDVENLDPIVNSILNKELRRTGGRVLIRLGNQDIDFSPSFKLFLSTRDPSVNFPPDICSRVTFVNFTITRGSLQSQCLNQVLKSERPDVDKKRTDLIKLQGEFQLKLRHLEKSLLQALNESEGNILEDDNVITTLETLKTEASDIKRKVEETDIVMEEVDTVTSIYTPLSRSCSSVFFLMEQLTQINHFYQFSLDFFMEIFQFVLLENPNLKDVKDSNKRLEILNRDLFQVSYCRASKGLLYADYIIFAVLLASLKLRSSSNSIDEVEYEYFLGGLETSPSKNSPDTSQLISHLGEEVAHRASKLASLKSFSDLIRNIEKSVDTWKALIDAETPELSVPICWDSGKDSPFSAAFRNLLVIKCFRPDRILAAASLFVEAVFGSSFNSDNELDLKSIIFDQVKATTPLAFCSAAGFDASYRVEHFAKEANATLSSVAMGSSEGYSLAESAIHNAVKRGTWVLLKNVHLSPVWLASLEKKLFSLKPNPAFRLFLTMETNPKVPVNILRLSRTLIFESAPGIKANLSDSLTAVNTTRLSKGPTERSRLYFLLAWLHSVVQERLRYSPLGWTKMYEFNDSDYDMALNLIDTWIDIAAQGKVNLSPTAIPWDAIRTLIKETVYGGKIDSEFDQKVLDTFVDTLFTPESYNLDFNLVKSDIAKSHSITIPEGTKWYEFIDWVKTLPERQPPHWLGLPNNAETVLMTSKGTEMLSKIRKVRNIADETEVGLAKESGNVIPAWMRTLGSTCSEWLSSLPDEVSILPKTVATIKDPLFRFLERENKSARLLLKQVRSDLSELIKICAGELKQTNHSKNLLTSFTKAIIPPNWIRYRIPRETTPAQWFGDFVNRLKQMEMITKVQKLNEFDVWIGGFFIPEAFITASRQSVAQKNSWSLEELNLVLDLGVSKGDNGFKLIGLNIEGAEWKNGGLHASKTTRSKIEYAQIRWVKDSVKSGSDLQVPVYLNADRTDLLFSASLQTENSSLSIDSVIQRAVAINLSSF